MTKETALNKYLIRFQPFKIIFKFNEDGVKLPYIYTQNYIAFPIISINKEFKNFQNELKTLFEVTYNDPIVMKTYTNGRIKSEDSFEYFINKQTFRWKNSYPFAAFIIKDKLSNNIVGMELLGNADNELGFIDNTANVSYMFNKNYHNKGIGYECVGALILGYGQYLFNNSKMINQIFSDEEQQFINGSPLKIIEASVQEKNIASSKILINLGFNFLYEFVRDEHIKLKYRKNLSEHDNGVILDCIGEINEY